MLNGQWALQDVAGDYHAPITFPGDGISALFEADLIPDPYYGRNEYDLRWISQRDWIASREFVLENTNVDLVLTGLDTIVDVTVNGVKVLSAENVFRTYRVNLSNVAMLGRNQIELYFHSSPQEAAKRYKNHAYPIPYQDTNSPIPHGNMIRKTQCDFGWDWNIALAPFGVIGDIEVCERLDARIEGVVVEQDHRENEVRVRVLCPVTISGETERSYEVSMCGQTVCGTMHPTKSELEATLILKNPDLWWPVGMGEQTLHDLVVTVDQDTQKRRVGLREMGHHTEKDEVGLGFKFSVNGQDIFAKGANWIPADALSGRITREKVQDLLQSAVDANMNMIRIWGGGRYEPDWFYDICDELGLLVWQDFMFSCNLYPANEAFLSEVENECREAVMRLNHHACIALWCGDNELVGALTWYEESLKNRDLYLVAYDRLNTRIERALRSVLPNANWWASSPSAGPMKFGDAWHDDTSGDMHFWSVWHEGKDFEHYRDVKPRFCSEFGFQSYASMEVIRSFAAPQDLNIAAPTIESHQKNEGGNARIAETMFRYFRFPVGFENFVYLSQIQHGLALKTAVSYWRSLKPLCMGALIWQLNDTWPVASWASLNYGGSWKLPHYMIADFFRPVFATIVPEGTKLLVKAVNDTSENIDVSVVLRATKISGQSRELAKATAKLGSDSAQTVTTLDASDIGDDEILTYEWKGTEGTIGHDHFMLKPYKSFDLVDPKLSVDVRQIDDDFELTVTSEKLALYTVVESDVAGRFSQNVLTVTPDTPAVLTFRPETAGQTPVFSLKNLHSATYE